MAIPKVPIGQCVKELRIQHGFTKGEFSRIIGTTCGFLTSIESDTCRPQKFLLDNIATAFGLRLSRLYAVAAKSTQAERAAAYQAELEQNGEAPPDSLVDANTDFEPYLTADIVRYAGSLVRTLRKHCGWTQQELSEKIGVSLTKLWSMENEKTLIPMDIAQKLLKVFGLEMRDFLLLTRIYTPRMIEYFDKISTRDLSLDGTRQPSCKLGHVITALRESFGLNQSQLARIVGCSRQVQSLVEKEALSPRQDICEHYAEYFGISYDELLAMTNLSDSEIDQMIYRLLPEKECSSDRKYEATVKKARNQKTKSGSIISLFRRSCGWTRKDLAWMLGISAEEVSSLETGCTPLTVSLLSQIAELFGLTEDEFVWFTTYSEDEDVTCHRYDSMSRRDRSLDGLRGVSVRAVGEGIRSLRTACNWTRKALAENVGISNNRLSIVEAGTGRLSIENLDKVSSLFGISRKQLVEICSKNTPEEITSQYEKLSGLHIGADDMSDGSRTSCDRKHLQFASCRG